MILQVVLGVNIGDVTELRGPHTGPIIKTGFQKEDRQHKDPRVQGTGETSGSRIYCSDKGRLEVRVLEFRLYLGLCSLV